LCAFPILAAAPHHYHQEVAENWLRIAGRGRGHRIADDMLNSGCACLITSAPDGHDHDLLNSARDHDLLNSGCKRWILLNFCCGALTVDRASEHEHDLLNSPCAFLDTYGSVVPG